MFEKPKTKRSLPKMGDKSRAFVHKALEVGVQHPEFLPRSLDLNEMKRDVELFEAIYPIAMALSQLKAELDDTLVAPTPQRYRCTATLKPMARAMGDARYSQIWCTAKN